MVDRSTAQYPLVIANPSLSDVIVNFRMSDYVLMAVTTVSSGLISFATGKNGGSDDITYYRSPFPSLIQKTCCEFFSPHDHLFLFASSAAFFHSLLTRILLYSLLIIRTSYSKTSRFSWSNNWSHGRFLPWMAKLPPTLARFSPE